jgi:hypothetical protein
VHRCALHRVRDTRMTIEVLLMAKRTTPPGKALRAKALKSKTAHAKSSREKVNAHRKRMQAKGLRLVQMWLPDTRSPEFAAQAHRASVAIANRAREADDQAFIDSVQWWTSKEAEDLWRTEPEGWWKEPDD